MNIIWTAFDRTRTDKTRPLMSAVFDSTTNKVDFYPLYRFGGRGEEVIERIKYLTALFDYPIAVNNFKAHIEGFNYLQMRELMTTNRDYQAYVIPEEEDINIPQDEAGLRKYLVSKLVQAKKMGTSEWQRLLGDATLSYIDLQRRGIRHGGLEVYPNYDLTTVNGRSRTTGFNIQGQGDGEDISHVDEHKNFFVHADWIAADIRAAALISEDQEMIKSFETSDPYTDMAEVAGRPRSEFKNKVVLPGLYSLNLNSEIFSFYPAFKKWATESIDKMDSQGYLTSMLGRKCHVKGTTESEILDSRRQVFNAQMQATVAHAMQNSIVQITKRLPRHILTEMHDSIVLCCTKDERKMVVETVRDVMLHPLRDIIPSDPTFPLKVSIGSKWREWKLLKEYR